MQANWSLVLNILMLLAVLVGIGLLMRARRRQQVRLRETKPSLGPVNTEPLYNDDIIAVRKIKQDVVPETHLPSLNKAEPVKQTSGIKTKTPVSLMLFLLAKEKRQFAGYDLLQTVLAAGLRFGEEQLFHRHQFPNGQGPVLCSLAAATDTGVFDLQNIGAFSVRGLCLFMKTSNNPGIDKERFSIMLDTARQLSEGLDAHLLDDQQKPLSAQRVERYLYQLQDHGCMA